MRGKPRSSGVRIWLGALTIFLILWPQFVGATSRPSIELPTPLGYVSDYADVLTPEWESRIRSICRDLEERAGVEMIVVTMPTIQPLTSARDYVSQLYEGWRIGTAQQEQGILLLIAREERQAVVALGRNLLSVIPPSLLDELTTASLTPMFRTSEFGKGLHRASVKLASVSYERVGPAADKDSSSTGFWLNLSMGLGILVILWLFVRPERRHPFRRCQRGEYWGSGQGGFGGNFGGFGGGMSGQGLS